MQARVIILLFFALVVAAFAVLNIQPVAINFFFVQTEIQLIFLIIIAVLFGALFMFILASMKQIKLTRKIKGLENENKSLKEEVEKLKGTSEPSVEEEETKEEITQKEEKTDQQPETAEPKESTEEEKKE